MRDTSSAAALKVAVLAQISAEIAARRTNLKALSSDIDRPYDSTRNYVAGEREMPLQVFLELCSGLEVSPEDVLRRAAERLT